MGPTDLATVTMQLDFGGSDDDFLGDNGKGKLPRTVNLSIMKLLVVIL